MALLRMRSPLLPGLVVFSLGLALAALFTWQTLRVNRQALSDEVSHQAESIKDVITQRLTLYTYGLRGARGHILTAGENGASRDGFWLYSASRDIDKEFPGARGFGFIRRVAQEREKDFIAHAHNEGFTDIAIHQFTPHSGERYIIQYAEPLDRNRQAIGVDVASEVHRRTAAMESMQSGEARITAPITLVQASGFHHQSFLIMLPVYRTGATPGTVEERQNATFGWSYVALLMQEVLKGLPLDEQFFSLELFDVTAPDEKVRFYSSDNFKAPTTGARHERFSGAFKHSMELKVLGRRWLLSLHTTPAFAKSMRPVDPLRVFLLGILLSVLSASLVSLLAMVRRRKHQIFVTQTKLAALVENSTDAIISKSLSGVVTSWNRGAEVMFGIPGAEALGRKVVDLIIPHDLAGEEAALMARLRNKESVSAFETRRCRRDGTQLQVSLALTPLCDAYGNIEGISTTVRDITAQKVAEAEVRALLEAQVAERTSELDEAHRNLQTILDGLPLLVGYWDRNLINRLANHCYEEWLGKAASSVTGMHLKTLIGEEMFAEISPAIDEVLGGGHPHFETTIPGKNERSDRHVVVHYIPDASGDVIQGFYVIAHDITDYRAMQNRHDQLRRLLEAVLNSASEVAIIATDLDGEVTLFNTGAERMLGYSSREVIGHTNMLEFHQAREIQARRAELGKELGVPVEGFQIFSELTARTGSDIRQWTYVRRDGTELQVSLVLTPMRGLLGELEGHLAIALDITAQQQHQQQLLALSHQLQIAAEAAELGIWSWNLATDTLDWNARMYELYEQPMQLRNSGLLLSHWSERVHPEDREEVFANIKNVLNQSNRLECYFRSLLPNNRIRHIHCVALVERDADGIAVRITGINRDITQQHEHEELIQKEKDIANAANKAKSAFLANMSHEIRTPLNAVLGMLQLMARTTLDIRQRDYVEKAHTAAKSLLNLLNDLLDFSKIDSGKLELDPHPFEPETLLRELAVVLSGNQQDKDIEILFDVDPRIPRVLVGDSQRLRQVLINLAGNAIKFTPQGYVAVSFHLQQLTAEDVLMRVAVEDTGIGISAEHQAKIFDGFIQAEASTSRRYGGTGLGLAISKRLVQLMGGDLQLSSKESKGSRFWFDLPLRAASTLPMVPQEPTERRLKTLVVDDNAFAGDILVRLINNLGWHADYAAHGHAAIERVSAAQEKQEPYQLVLMDWRMPGMNGAEAAQQIKDTITGDTPVVVMVTAFAREEVLSRTQGATPFADLLTKPVTPQQLVDTVAAIFGENSEKAADPDAITASAQADQPIAGMKILVVEDNSVNRQVADELLTGVGATVTLAESGLEALRILDHDSAFNVVIMDMQMPELDGLETTRRIRLRPGLGDLPILAMTANASPSDRDACLAAGMNDHISKPIDVSQLVPALLHLTSGTKNTATPAPPAEPLMEDEKLIVQRFGGNRALLARLSKRFAPEVERHLQDLRRLLVSTDAVAVSGVLHSLKGVAANMGARALAAMLGQLERRVKDHPDRVAAETLTEEALASLTQLAAVSVEQLRIMVEGEPAIVAKRVATKTFTAGDLLQSLRDLQPLLSSGDLHAIQMIEKLVAAHPDAELLSLADLIQSLQFTKAKQLLDQLILSRERP